MQNNSFSVLFFIKKSKLLKNGEAPICMRITVNSKRAEVQVKRSMEPDKWNHLKGCAVGKERKHQEINLYLETGKKQFFQIHRQLEADGKPITAVTIKNIFYGGYDSPKCWLKHSMNIIRSTGNWWIRNMRKARYCVMSGRSVTW